MLVEINKSKLSAGILATILFLNIASCSNRDGSEGLEAGSQGVLTILKGPQSNKEAGVSVDNTKDDDLEERRTTITEEYQDANPNRINSATPIFGKPGKSRAGQPNR